VFSATQLPFQEDQHPHVCVYVALQGHLEERCAYQSEARFVRIECLEIVERQEGLAKVVGHKYLN